MFAIAETIMGGSIGGRKNEGPKGPGAIGPWKSRGADRLAEMAEQKRSLPQSALSGQGQKES